VIIEKIETFPLRIPSWSERTCSGRSTLVFAPSSCTRLVWEAPNTLLTGGVIRARDAVLEQ
jgi:hypothetical protein